MNDYMYDDNYLYDKLKAEAEAEAEYERDKMKIISIIEIIIDGKIKNIKKEKIDEAIRILYHIPQNREKKLEKKEEIIPQKINSKEIPF